MEMPMKRNQEEANPCSKEQAMSYKCLNDNNFDREKCEVFFVNYNNCKEFWNKIRLSRKRKGIIPNMPPLSERAKIKEEFFENLNKNK
ncbi:coiled-coil-helix-coiled-coil-helix domain-containing protein 7 [Chrysoperla carnea]|uniref:coiled-coil-helix-coiled-coil-helix domain-containing protein 7 n=1 Tax=Chrysoperla carnea TaxID=189513 RepID=UPI001D05F1C4|nr:coiled-coil-helix-coiled-coil-helix domain-containing protein 7 [Chrysoperla carnea]